MTPQLQLIRLQQVLATSGTCELALLRQFNRIPEHRSQKDLSHMPHALPAMRFSYSDLIAGAYKPQPLRSDLAIGTRQGGLRRTVRQGLDE